jgi:Methane oxygenase PmoA
MRKTLWCLFVLSSTLCPNAQNQAAGLRADLPKKSEKEGEHQGVSFKEEAGKIEIFVAGHPFTTYHFQGYDKPIFFPLRAASGTTVTRGYPIIQDIPGEAKDHPHHKGLWLTHGDVNGIDFWGETPEGGKIVHRKFELIKNDRQCGVLRSRNDWLSPDGKRVLEEIREVKIYNLPNARVMDLGFKLSAANGPVKFGDTKEGSFGIRLAQPFSEREGGRIENARGAVGEKNCWGKQADWVDYTTTIKGEKLGVTIFDHPTSFRHPTFWHVRGYTLFAVNPFGLHDFYNDKTKDGSYLLRAGESLILRYRVYIHSGSTQEAKISEQYKAYIKSSNY